MSELPVSHVKISGGSYRFYGDKEHDFLEGYAKLSLTPPKDFTWVERVTPNFKFFVDIDIKRSMDETEILEMSRDICTKMNIDGPVLISFPTERPRDKTGIHINTTKIVNYDTACSIVESLNNPYIDTIPYNNGGLRMLWSFKKDGGAPYVPQFMWNNKTKEFEEPWTDRLQLLKTFSVRHVDESLKTKKYVKKYDETFDILSTFLRTRFSKMGSFYVLDIKKHDEVPDCLLIKTNSKFCLNKDGNHTNNHVYFVVKKDFHTKSWFVHQRCNSTNGTCATYRSREQMLKPSIETLLKDKGYI